MKYLIILLLFVGCKQEKKPEVKPLATEKRQTVDSIPAIPPGKPWEEKLNRTLHWFTKNHDFHLLAEQNKVKYYETRKEKYRQLYYRYFDSTNMAYDSLQAQR